MYVSLSVGASQLGDGGSVRVRYLGSHARGWEEESEMGPTRHGVKSMTCEGNRSRGLAHATPIPPSRQQRALGRPIPASHGLGLPRPRGGPHPQLIMRRGPFTSGEGVSQWEDDTWQALPD
ncbi:hypothetical protein ACLOJK_033252 [Asimina triloba]